MRNSQLQIVTDVKTVVIHSPAKSSFLLKSLLSFTAVSTGHVDEEKDERNPQVMALDTSDVQHILQLM